MKSNGGADGDGALFRFRRVLRVTDNAGLYRALADATRVYCVFMFDRGILDELPSKFDRRVEFIRETVVAQKQALQALRGDVESGPVPVRHRPYSGANSPFKL